MDHFYEIHIQHSKDEYFVYFRCPEAMNPDDVPAAAVKSGDLIDVDLVCVDYVLEITSEEYFTHMFE